MKDCFNNLKETISCSFKIGRIISQVLSDIRIWKKKIHPYVHPEVIVRRGRREIRAGAKVPGQTNFYGMCRFTSFHPVGPITWPSEA